MYFYFIDVINMVSSIYFNIGEVVYNSIFKMYGKVFAYDMTGGQQLYKVWYGDGVIYNDFTSIKEDLQYNRRISARLR